LKLNSKFVGVPSIIFVLVFLTISLFSISAVFGEQSSQFAPVNPAFQQQQQERLRAVAQPAISGEGFSLGHKASPVDLSHLKGQKADLQSTPQLQKLGYPVSYDLRSAGKVTSVKDQGNCGSCWAFATYGSLESNYLTDETWNFSENNMKNTHGYDWAYCDGGNAYIAMAYLARWSGPISEAADPYNPASGVSPSGLSPRKHIQEVLIVPAKSSATDNDGIKEAILTYGGLAVSLYYSSASYNSTTYAYYYSGAGTNHEVTLVGWDDNYDKSNFNTTPAGNGAYIAKNSWGASWGDNGYFYISYYDTVFGYDEIVAFVKGESRTNYKRIYQYDPLGWTGNIGYGGKTAWAANVFKAKATETITAVSFYTPSANSTYKVYIYKGVSGTTDPTNGTLAGSLSGTIAHPGYHTLSLYKGVSVIKGQKFSVVVKFTTPGYNYPIAIEYPYSNYSSLATANPGESFISPGGSSWYDFSAKEDANVCIKAFAGYTYKVTVNAKGKGKGGIITSPAEVGYSYPAAATGSAQYIKGSKVVIAAKAKIGSVATWGGTCVAAGGTGTNNNTGRATCTIRDLSKAASITATFKPAI